MNPIILPLAKGTRIETLNLNIWTSALKIDLVLDPACAEGLIYTFNENISRVIEVITVLS